MDYMARKKRKRKFKTKKHTLIQEATFLVGGLVIIIMILLGQYDMVQVPILTISLIGAFILLIVFVGVLIVRKRIRDRKRQEWIKQRTLAQYRAMDPFEFEHLVAEVFRRVGYKISVTQGSGDHGIDCVVEKKGKRFAVQVKRYDEKNTISEPMLREFYGSCLDDFNGGYYVTTSFFTAPAKKWASKRGLTLFDANDFMDLMEKARLS